MSNSKKLRLDLPLVLPDVSEVHDRCVLRRLCRNSGAEAANGR